MSTESCGYRFDLTFDKREHDVSFKVQRVNEADLPENIKGQLEGCFADCGKWETIMKALFELGFSKTPIELKNPTLTDKPYTVIIEAQNEKIVTGKIRWSVDERHKRDGHITVEELQQQLPNVDKWRNLKKAISLLRSQSAKP